MKIQAAPELLVAQVQSRIGKALAHGETVTVPLPTAQELPQLISYLNSPAATASAGLLARQFGQQTVFVAQPGLLRHIESRQLGWTPQQQLVIGAGSGAVMGAGVGLLLEALRSVAPKTGATLALACTLFGGGLGAALGSGVISSAELEIDPATGLPSKLKLCGSGAKDA